MSVPTVMIDAGVDTVEHICADLHAAADPDNATPMAAYMQGHFEFLGVSAPERRRLSKPLLTWAKTADPDELLDVCLRLWDHPARECQYTAMDALRSGARNLRADDLDAIARCITMTPWWDTVDSLAIHTVGTMVQQHPELVDQMDEWIGSDDLWIARSAILHQVTYDDRTDAKRLFSYCEQRMHDTDFFIRKAIGWALREYANTDPAAVSAFVQRHQNALSGLSRREALKHL